MRDESNWIQSFSGKQVWPTDMRPEDVCLEDVAHALSNLCRFTGHCRKFYSVAEHSVLVSRQVPPADALRGLLHDASEAYLLDLAKPVKLCPELAEYRRLEAGVERAVCDHFRIAHGMPESVKVADFRMLATEARQIMGPPPASWRLDGVESYPITIECWEPERAEREFLTRFWALTR